MQHAYSWLLESVMWFSAELSSSVGISGKKNSDEIRSNTGKTRATISFLIEFPPNVCTACIVDYRGYVGFFHENQIFRAVSVFNIILWRNLCSNSILEAEKSLLYYFPTVHADSIVVSHNDSARREDFVPVQFTLFIVHLIWEFRFD